MKNYNVIIKETQIKEYTVIAKDKDEVFNNIMDFYMYEDDSEETKTVIEVEIKTENK